MVTVSEGRVEHRVGDDVVADRARVEVARAVGQSDEQARPAEVATVSARVPLERPGDLGEVGVTVTRRPLDRTIDPAQRILETRDINRL